MISALVIFIGFAMPFEIGGKYGFIVAFVAIIFGAMLFWIVEKRTKHSLDKATPLNKILKAEGDNLIKRK